MDNNLDGVQIVFAYVNVIVEFSLNNRKHMFHVKAIIDRLIGLK